MLEKTGYFLFGMTIATLCGFMSYWSIDVFPWQSHWLLTPGQVTSHRCGAGTQNTLTFTYIVDGNPAKMQGRQHFFYDGAFVETGDPVSVRYDPANPSNCTIKTGAAFSTCVWGFLACTFGLLGVCSFRDPPATVINET